MGIRDYYRQFEGMPLHEVSAELREQAGERRRAALARIEPLDLSVTTWPEYPPHSVVSAITYAARRGLHRYLDPHGSELREELALRHGVDTEQIVLGDGIGQLMTAAAQVLLAAGDELVTPWPGYPLHPLVARGARGQAVPVGGFAVDALLAAVNPRTRVVALANPNDPTGELLDVAELTRLLAALPERVVVLLDEALRDFVTAEPVDATLRLLDAHPRLVVFRTFSKAWGLAGLRCGYAIGGSGAIELLAKLEPELGFNELALAGTLEAVRNHPRLPSSRAAIIAEHRELLRVAFDERPATFPPSQANVLWISADAVSGADLASRLDRHGIRVRGGGVLGDPDRVRVTVPHRRGDVERLLRAFDASLQSG